MHRWLCAFDLLELDGRDLRRDKTARWGDKAKPLVWKPTALL
jgi:hypothetical protein